jgi:hypothetical protein
MPMECEFVFQWKFHQDLGGFAKAGSLAAKV